MSSTQSSEWIARAALRFSADTVSSSSCASSSSIGGQASIFHRYHLSGRLATQRANLSLNAASYSTCSFGRWRAAHTSSRARSSIYSFVHSLLISGARCPTSPGSLPKTTSRASSSTSHSWESSRTQSSKSRTSRSRVLRFQRHRCWPR